MRERDEEVPGLSSRNAVDECGSSDEIDAVPRHRWLPLLAVMSSALAAQSRVASRCPLGTAPFATPACAELVATPDLPAVRGMLELRRVRSAMGVSVTAEGQLRRELVAELRNLPQPASLGGRVFVAWGYDLTHAQEVNLGAVRNGFTVLGEVPFEYFRVLISVEQRASTPTRRGRLVARATSPNTLMLAHRDAMAPMMNAPGEPHGAGHGAHWPSPPADPRLAPSAMVHAAPTTAPWLPGDPGNLRIAQPREVRHLRNGDTLALTAGVVAHTLGGRRVVLFGYNGQYPGPLLQVPQGANIVVRFRNELPMATTVHWHGLRLDNRYDGVPHHTQPPVAPGDTFTYHLRFPDAGVYWYHPHVREDIQQELGLHGNIAVTSRATRRAVDHDEVLALDDFLFTDDGQVMPFGADTATYTLMGRFGNVLLVNGVAAPNYRLQVRPGATVRFAFTNVANARMFNLRIPNVPFRLIGSDLGDFEREESVPSIPIAPAERYIVEVRFDRPGRYPLLNSVRWLDHMRGTSALVVDTLGVIEVAGTPTGRVHPAVTQPSPVRAEIARVMARAPRRPDHRLTLGMRLTGVAPSTVAMLTGIAMPVDWNDAMPMTNWSLTAREVTWTLRDEQGRENMEIDWRFRRGQVARILIANDPGVTHAMAHPIHFHGQRFVVASRNGVPNDNMVWKDTAVLPAGEEMEIVLELTNPGTWMMHCHIAEHLGTGMMGRFTVADTH